MPFRLRRLPNELCEIMAVLVVAEPAALRGEIELVPPCQFGLRRQRLLFGLDAADQIAADGNERLAALGPEGGHDVSRARAPVKTSEDCLLDLECVHQGDNVERDDRLLAVPERIAGKEARGAVAAQIGNDYPVARRGQHRGDVNKAVNVIRPAVQKNDRRTIRRAGLGVADVELAGVYLLQRTERLVRPRLDGRQS